MVANRLPPGTWTSGRAASIDSREEKSAYARFGLSRSGWVRKQACPKDRIKFLNIDNFGCDYDNFAAEHYGSDDHAAGRRTISSYGRLHTQRCVAFV